MFKNRGGESTRNRVRIPWGRDTGVVVKREGVVKPVEFESPLRQHSNSQRNFCFEPNSLSVETGRLPDLWLVRRILPTRYLPPESNHPVIESLQPIMASLRDKQLVSFYNVLQERRTQSQWATAQRFPN